MKTIILTIPFFGLLIMTSCSKNNTPVTTNPVSPQPVQVDSFYNTLFSNATDTTVTVDVYETATDYTNCTNKVLSLHVKGDTSFHIIVKAGSALYIDYYSSSYNFSNWDYTDFTTTSKPQSVLVYTASANAGLTISGNTNIGDDRMILLNGNQPSTTWKVVAAYKAKGASWIPYWDSLTTIAQGMTMVFNKNFVLNFTDTAGIAQTCSFSHNGDKNNLRGDVTTSSGSHLGAFNDGIYLPATHAKDTLGFQYDNQDVRYIFVRQ